MDTGLGTLDTWTMDRPWTMPPRSQRPPWTSFPSLEPNRSTQDRRRISTFSLRLAMLPSSWGGRQRSTLLSPPGLDVLDHQDLRLCQFLSLRGGLGGPPGRTALSTTWRLETWTFTYLLTTKRGSRRSSGTDASEHDLKTTDLDIYLFNHNTGRWFKHQ